MYRVKEFRYPTRIIWFKDYQIGKYCINMTYLLFGSVLQSKQYTIKTVLYCMIARI
jgi:hypothetical protein